jgi:acyl carrier protein
MPKSTNEILDEVTVIVRDLLRDPSVTLRYDTRASDIKGWDSLNHIEIIVALEKHFGIKFNFAELQRFQNVGQMCDGVAKRIRGTPSE